MPIEVLNSAAGFWYLLVSPPSSELTYIITIDSVSGDPMYSGVPLVDVFPDRSMALKEMTEIGAKTYMMGQALLGLIQYERQTIVGIILQSEVTGTLPGGHEVRTVRDKKFLQIPIGGSPATNPKPSLVEEFQLVNNHFYCESYDATRLFPNKNGESDKGFVWNVGWKRPFEAFGIANVCVDLIQGVCRSSKFANLDFQVTYVARRSVKNPGTRYAARGLNDENSPGNEVECELIFVRGDRFWSSQWRRGSIPIRWKTTLSSSLAAPQHRVDTNFFEGTLAYFKGLTERFGDVDIRLVSLLETDSDHAEQEIKNYFRMAVSKVAESGAGHVTLFPFDLNHHLHSAGTGEAMMDFLSFLGPLSEGDGFNTGKVGGDVEERQRGLMRFNCADSLDRTNLATFYFAMNVAAEWCLEQGVGVRDARAGRNLPHLIICQEIIDFLAVSFVDSGNVVSYLYTNTPAIKVKAIRSFSSSVEKQSSDTSVTMQRRLQNVVNDPQRMKVIELWTNPPPLRWCHRLDPRHVFTIPTSGPSIPRSILSTVPKPIKLQKDQNELLVCFPCPMQLCSFWLLLFPTTFNATAKRVTISLGRTLMDMKPVYEIPLPVVQAPMWCRYVLTAAGRWAMDAPRLLSYARFMSLKFDVVGESFCVGNVRIDARSIFSKRPNVEVRQPRACDEEESERFTECFVAFAASKRKLRDVLELEKVRLGLRVPENQRKELALKEGFNPWIADAEGQLVAASMYCCVLCERPCVQNEVMEYSYFKPAPVLRGLLTKSEDKTGLRVCRDCLEHTETILQTLELYQEEFRPRACGLPSFECGSSNVTMPQVITTQANASFSTGGNSLLRKAGGSVTIEANSEREFSMVIIQQAIVVEILVEASTGSLDIISSDGTPLTRKDGEPLSFMFQEALITQRLSFTVKSGDEPVELRRLQVIYVATQYQLDEINPPASVSPISIQPSSLQGYYADHKRTETFKFPKAIISRFWIEVVADRAFPMPVSLIIACYLDGTLAHSEHFLIPEVSCGMRLWFSLSSSVVCDSLLVFYLDRHVNIKPHVIRISLDKA